MNMKHKISVSTSSVDPMNPALSFRVAKQSGFDGVELMISPSKFSQDVNHIKDLIQKYQIPVTSIHAPTLLLCKLVWTTDPAVKLQKSVEFAEAVGADSVVVHPPFKRKPHAAKLLDQVNHLNATHDVQVGVENMFPWIVRGHATEVYGPSWEDTIKGVDWLTFDFSHAALSGMDVMGFFKENWEKVRVIHLTDGSTRNQDKSDSAKDEHMLPGEGSMPLAEVYALLNEKGWRGETVLEINTRGNKIFEKKKKLELSRDFFNRIANSEG